jgi:hypothetical protein
VPNLIGIIRDWLVRFEDLPGLENILMLKSTICYGLLLEYLPKLTLVMLDPSSFGAIAGISDI